ncbi:Serine/threonine-protein kinase PrkC [Roseimaritima multifibrata]|uniref:non-specific serine/threonine protein kinase n=1 Tax=Roseimaritima multifibrata TaxID=1930274 RepID=A0A517MFX4_9BACT|nr:serine/threonine-protein kinase [Roseimaritima multifibrata]QDS93779.1 Serine/threonine-protein kinase PrkC [Roseimaritima multifibrata]
MTDSQDHPKGSSPNQPEKGVTPEHAPLRAEPPKSPQDENGSVELTGQLLGDYQILRRLGRGGMADVYVAQQISLGRQVAIKVLRRDLSRDAKYVERFRREARAVARLSHANIVQVFEVGEQNSHHYIVQEFVDGRNLREQLEREGAFSVVDGIKILIGVTEALSAAADANITHRDIKPENVMVSNRGEIKVADFGLARMQGGDGVTELTQVGLTMGTPRYMSPEQVQGKAVDIRSDMYSLGVTMFHLLTGRPPFEADDALAMAVKHLHEAPPSLIAGRASDDLPNWLVTIVEKLLCKDPEGRFQTPQQLSEAIRMGVTNQASSLSQSTIQLSASMALQYAVDSHANYQRTTVWRNLILWLLPLIGLLSGAAFAASWSPPSIRQLLAADSFQVTVKDSATAQFLEAASVDQPSAWKAVWELHPPSESESNREYALKAKLQLARLYQQRGEWKASEKLMRDILKDGQLQPVFQTLALSYLVLALDAQQESADASEQRESLHQYYKDLNPLDKDLVHRKGPSAIVTRLRATSQ